MFSEGPTANSPTPSGRAGLANSVLNALPAHIAVLDARGVIVWVNQPWADFARANGSPDGTDYVGANYLDVCAAAMQLGDAIAQQVGPGLRAVLASEQPSFSREYQCPTPTQACWFTVSVLPVRPAGSGAVVIHQDITTQKQAEAQARAAHAQMEALTAAVPGVVYQFRVTATGDWQFVYVSQGITGLYEVAPEAALANHNALTECILPEDRAAHRAAVENSFRSLRLWVHEHRIRTPSGRIKWVRGQASPQPQADGSVLWNGLLVDITELKRAEEALRHSYERSEMMQRIARVGYLDWDLATNQLDLSAEALEILHLDAPPTIDEIMGMVPPAHQERVGASLFAAAAGASRHNLDHPMRRPDGAEVYVQATADLVRAPDGAPARLLGTILDITERRQAEEAVRASEARYKRIIDTTDEGIWMVSTAGTTEFINARGADILGYQTADMLGHAVLEFVFPEDRAWSQSEIARNLGGERVSQTYRMRHRSGQAVWLQSNTMPIYDQAEQNVTGMLSMFTDITERRQAEAALRASEQRYRLLAEHANDVIWTMTPAGQVTYVSPSVVHLRGYTVPEVLRQRLDEIVCPGSLATMQDEFQRALAETRDGPWRPARYVEIEQPCRDGTTVWTEVTVRLMYDAAGQPSGLVGVSRDITERRRLQEQLREQANTDELTGLFNRRHFLEIAHGELKRSRRQKHPLALALLDIDGLKRLNDNYGHAAGDEALRTLAHVCWKNIREVDQLARFGGDEFAVLFPETQRDQALDILERARQALLAAPLALPGGPAGLTVTFSAGLAGLASGDETVDALLGRADQALYLAKRAGGNAVLLEGAGRVTN